MKKLIWKAQFIFWAVIAGQKFTNARGFANEAFAENNYAHHLRLTPKEAAYEYHSWASK